MHVLCSRDNTELFSRMLNHASHLPSRLERSPQERNCNSPKPVTSYLQIHPWLMLGQRNLALTLFFPFCSLTVAKKQSRLSVYWADLIVFIHMELLEHVFPSNSWHKRGHVCIPLSRKRRDSAFKRRQINLLSRKGCYRIEPIFYKGRKNGWFVVLQQGVSNWFLLGLCPWYQSPCLRWDPRCALLMTSSRLRQWALHRPPWD